MKKWIPGIILAALSIVAAFPVLGCIAIPQQPPNAPKDMSLEEQRAFLYEQDGKEHLILSVKYNGATPQFAWVIPTETQPSVNVQKGAPFHELWRLTEIRAMRESTYAPGGPPMAGAGPPPVVVLERKTEGPYDIAVLKATGGGALYDWLQANGFSLTPAAREALDYYTRRNWYFAAARIRPGGAGNSKIQQNLKGGTIAALHLAFKATELSYPLRVTAGNPGNSNMEVFVVGDGIQRPRNLQALQFRMTPDGADAFRVTGPPGLAYDRGDYPTLRSLLPRGGTLHKFSGVLSAKQRTQDMVFRKIPGVAVR